MKPGPRRITRTAAPISEDVLIEAIRRDPRAVAPRMVYADWLEDQGDTGQARLLRAACLHRRPIERDELARFDRLAEARRRRSADLVVLAVDARAASETYGLDAHDAAVLATELGQLHRTLVGRHFPRDDEGQLALGACVLLAPVGHDEFGNRRALHLVARGPGSRRDAQVIRIDVEETIAEQSEHDWGRTRWLWDRRRAGAAPEERWGVGEELVELTRYADGAQRQGELERARAERSLSDVERAALATLWQDAGRFEDALELWGIGVSPEVTRMLNAEVFRVEGDGGCDCRYRDAAPERAAALRRVLWEAAPWRLISALQAERQRLDDWRAARRGRPRRAAALRLVEVPNQTHARRAALTLTRGSARPLLAFRFSDTLAKPARSMWVRPPELDLRRLGLA